MSLLKNILPVRLALLISALLLPVTIMGQLTAPGMNAVRYTSYPSSPGVKDPVFVYCNSSGTVKGSLSAVSPGGTGPFTFSWYRWSDATKGFTVFISSETGVMSSTITNLDEGGYRVNISNGSGYNSSLTGWIFTDRPSSLAKLQNRTCDYVALSGKVAVDTFFYSDPTGGQRIRLPNGVKFLWSSSPVSSIPYPDIEINPQTFNPPLENVTYRLLVTDSLGCTGESSFFYESIHVKADFSVDPSSGEAPLEVTFTDKSIRATTYLWEFGDDSISVLSTPKPHTYYIPKDYSVKLTVESDLHCIDSVRFEKIVVDDSKLEIPNVFTPNEDGINDKFMVNKASLRYISVVIFSRNGTKVYDFFGEGQILKEWDGWDGNVGNSSAKASPGVYFYIIKALGWDDVKYDSKEYRGFVYLYR
ncbi:MAG TPA: gliding motility-associated C-terminal domain-containing protein [Bacteroidales bacterium]|nr:gliding motility-associated C-terminal domain-containing protein [Bacteroidales bacterium]